MSESFQRKKRERARCVSGTGIFRDESRMKTSDGYNWWSIFVYAPSQRDSHSQVASKEAGVVPKILCLLRVPFLSEYESELDTYVADLSLARSRCCQ